ncbi:MAG: 30S ribosomal protein S8 [Panacagrimonas sp.]
MSMTDPVADFLTRLRNGQSARKKSIKAPSSKLKQAIADVLQDEGYILGYDIAADGNKKTMTVALKYFDGKPVIEKIDRISTPSLRVYKAKDELPKVLGGLGIAIISTASGVVSDRKARAAGQGGEVICVVS